jgi:hypothetical protein
MMLFILLGQAFFSIRFNSSQINLPVITAHFLSHLEFRQFPVKPLPESYLEALRGINILKETGKRRSKRS